MLVGYMRGQHRVVRNIHEALATDLPTRPISDQGGGDGGGQGDEKKHAHK